MRHAPKPIDPRHRGFSLIVVVTLMTLVAVLALGMLSLSSATLRGTQQDNAMSIARANARLALQLAIAELQKQAGPDQRITARAELLDSESPNPMWTAVWNSEGGDPAYLVSGNTSGNLDLSSIPDNAYPAGYHLPGKPLPPERSSLLFGAALPSEEQVRAPDVHLTGTQNGSYAFWIADEGVKARIDLRNPYRAADSDEERRLALSTSQSNSIAYASSSLRSLWPADESKFDRLLSLNQAVLLVPEIPDFHKQYFHDLTAHSQGLLTDAKHGGLKRDLTLAFENEEVFERWFGRKQSSETPKKVNADDVVITTEGGYEHNVNTNAQVVSKPGADKFFISDEFKNYRGKEAGPNWGILCHYYNLHKKVQNSADDFPVVFPHPPVGMQARRTGWDPYSQYIGSAGNVGYEFHSDLQHTNNYVAPVPGRFQMSYRLKAMSLGQRSDGQDLYSIILEFKPVIGVWNPYNVTFRGNRYRLEWEMSPVLKVEIEDPGGRSGTMEIDMTGWYGRSDNGDLLTLLTKTPVDLRPGELRIFSLNAESDMKSRNFRAANTGNTVGHYGYYELEAAWGAEGYFQMPLPEQFTIPQKNAAFRQLAVTGQAKIRVVSLSLSEQTFSEQSWTDTAGNWFSLKPGSENAALQRVVSTSRSTNIWQPDAPDMSPEVIEDSFPPMSPAALLSSQDLGTWVFSLRSTLDEPGQNIRNLIDANVRAANLNSRWDGSHGGMGLTALSPYKGAGPNGRGLLMAGAPPEPPSSLDRYSMWHGDGNQPYVVCFDLPHSQPLSLGQFQHAVLARYSNEPSFVLGNSYAGIRIPLDKKVNENFLGQDTGNEDTGLRTFDISYLVNEEIWDRYFLSGLSADDSLLPPDDFKKIARNEMPAPNARVKILDPTLEKKNLLSPSDERLSDELAARLAIQGAFNVNSTSVAAWRAVLAGMADLKVPVVDPATKAKTWEDPKGVTFSRFSNNAGKQGDLWKGFQHLDDAQLDALAKEIVNQVRARGPFRSLGDFVNRSLERTAGNRYDGPDIRLSGALQTALDHKDVGINSEISKVAADASDLEGGHFEKILDGQSKATGYAGFILQGDILQSIAPVITVRSDTFMIRTTGTARDNNGKITAQAWCEALVQRTPQPLDPSQDLTGNDKVYGRKFVPIHFRWLSRDEI